MLHLPASAAADVHSSEVPLFRVKLIDLSETRRFAELDKLESYFRCTQDDRKEYDWDGRFRGYGAVADIEPGWYVPIRNRRPDTRYDMARLITTRLTSMVFGGERFPTLRVEGDEDAEDYVQELCRSSRLPARMIEMRNLGGATGTGCASIGFVKGKPRVEVHNAKHCTVLEWEDEGDFRPAKVLKTFSYKRTMWDRETGKPKLVDFFYARYWDQDIEIEWEPIPGEVAKTAAWQMWPKKVERAHRAGFCPFYWVQNLPDSTEVDGEGDYEPFTDLLDRINALASSTNEGTIANIVPTLVIHDLPTANEGTVRKGREQAIYAEKGASYLELKGEAIRSAKELGEMFRGWALDHAQVVLPAPEKLAAHAQSAAAMRVLYAPMIARCDQLREQYGQDGVVQIVKGLLRMAKQILATPPEPEVTEDGEIIEKVPAILLPPRVETETNDEGETEITYVDRLPGESEEITLSWGQYFSPTLVDIKAAVEAARLANGNKQLLSQKTSMEWVGQNFGVEDVDLELARIEEDAQKSLESTAQMYALGAAAADPLGLEGDRSDGADQTKQKEKPGKGD